MRANAVTASVHEELVAFNTSTDRNMINSRIQRTIDPNQTYLSRASTESFGLYHDMIQSSGATTSLLGDTFEATIAAHHFGRLTLFDRQIIGANHRRDPTQIRRDGFEHYYLQVLRSGRMVSGLSGEERRLVPGDAVLFDATQPMRSIVEDADYVTVILARDLVEVAAPDARHLHGRILPKGEAGSLGETVLSLIRGATRFPQDLTVGSSHVIAGMLGQIQGYSETAFRDAVGESNVELSRRLKAEIFIENNLGRDLSVDFVARSIGVSRASLYRAMSDVGGIETVVTRRRAARLRSLILRPGQKTSITRFAERVGFASLSHGSRVFKQMYGQSPDQLRAMLRADARSAAQALQPGRMRDWYGAMNG
ncbi:helix-turn-helix domain-containing protein [Methylobacterium phyllosphaerae]